jgi:hypothetical protein
MYASFIVFDFKGLASTFFFYITSKHILHDTHEYKSFSDANLLYKIYEKVLMDYFFLNKML